MNDPSERRINQMDEKNAEALAREAHELRMEQERIKDRLHEIAIELEGHGPVIWDDMQGHLFKATATYRTTLQVDEAKMRAIAPSAYEKYSERTLSKTRLRAAIQKLQVKGWEKFAWLESSEPYISIKEMKETSREETASE